MKESMLGNNNYKTEEILLSLPQLCELFEAELYRKNFAANIKVEDMFKLYTQKDVNAKNVLTPTNFSK